MRSELEMWEDTGWAHQRASCDLALPSIVPSFLRAKKAVVISINRPGARLVERHVEVVRPYEPAAEIETRNPFEIVQELAARAVVGRSDGPTIQAPLDDMGEMFTGDQVIENPDGLSWLDEE